AGADAAVDRGDFCAGSDVGNHAGELFPGDGGETDFLVQSDSSPFSSEGVERAAGGCTLLADFGVVRSVRTGDGEAQVSGACRGPIICAETARTEPIFRVGVCA